MSSNHKDRILDSMLEEAIGGHHPPDLTPKILQALDAKQASADGESVPLPPPVAPPVQALHRSASANVASAGGGPLIRVAKQARSVSRQSRSHVTWLNLALSFGLIAVGISAFVVIESRKSIEPEVPLAVNQPQQPKEPPVDLFPPVPRKPEWRFDLVQEESGEGRNRDEDVDAGQIPPGDKTPAQVPPFELPAPRLASAADDTSVIKFVDQAIQRVWRENNVVPALAASDQQWCQRVYTRLIGRRPTAAEIRQFTDDDSPDRRADLVDQLLASSEYDRHWAEVWTDALADSPKNDRRSRKNRDGLRDYLHASFAENEPFAKVAYELISADGSNNPKAEDFNGAVNFLAANAGDDATKATDRTARVFLGKQLHCAQCHDHPANDWRQSDFWALNAFFRQLDIARDPATQTAKLVDRDFFGETGSGRDAEIFYEQPNGQLRIAYPRLNGQELSHSGFVGDIHRRYELARLIISSDDFSKAVVNRVWGELFGYGFTDPVDDMGPHNPASHEDILVRLSGEFEAHRFDIDSLVRWIVLSAPFGLSEQPSGENWLDAPEAGGKPLFARMYPEDTKSRDVRRSLILAADHRQRLDGVPATTQASRVSIGQTRIPLDISDHNVTSGQGFEAGLSTIQNGWMDALAAADISEEQKIEHVFWAIIGRSPNAAEMTAARLVMADRMDAEVGLAVIWRALSAHK